MTSYALDTFTLMAEGMPSSLKSQSMIIPIERGDMMSGRELIGCCKGDLPDLFKLYIKPNGLSIKGRYWREGTIFHAAVHIQAAGAEPQTVQLSVDLAPIVKAMTAMYQKYMSRRGVTVGFGFSLKKIWKSAKKIGKSKLIKGIGKAVKAVAKSKITGAIVTGLAVAVPAIGVPAAAAYATANAAIAAIEKAKKVKSSVQKVVAKGTPAQKAVLKANLVKKVAPVLKAAETAKKNLGAIAREAKQGNPDAKKMATVINEVAKHRARVENYGVKLDDKQSSPGLLVTQAGKIVPGKFLNIAAVASQAAARA